MDEDLTQLRYVATTVFKGNVEVERVGDDVLMLTRDGDYQDIGRVQGAALGEAGFTIIGAHTDREDRECVERYSVIRTEDVGDYIEQHPPSEFYME